MKNTYRVMKTAEKHKNRITIPKFIIDKFGRDFYLELYEDGTIKLVPIKKEKKGA